MINLAVVAAPSDVVMGVTAHGSGVSMAVDGGLRCGHC